MKKTILILIIGVLISSCSSSKSNSNEIGINGQGKKFDLVENKVRLDSLLAIYSNKPVDSNKPIVVIYYPGKDSCNSSGASTRESTKEWFDKMEKGIDKITQANLFYIYKDSTGLYGRHDGFKKWFQDPEQIFEQMFQKPIICDGFILISAKGEFISHPSEFDQPYIWKRLKDLIK